MTNASVNDPCECGQTTIRGCADMPSRHCGMNDAAPDEIVDDFEASTVSARAYLDLASEIERLRADNVRLREALAPFGRVAERDVGESEHDNDRFVPITPKNVRSQVLYVRDFRRARTAMETSNGNK
jgi:hypothetical protein